MPHERTGNGLCCPNPDCGAYQVVVTNSRGLHQGRTVKRRRHCHACGCRFTAYERIDPTTITYTTSGKARAPETR